MIELRESTAADRDLLRAIYASTRSDELALVGWDQATADAFIEQQFTAQDVQYRAQCPGATFSIVERDGEPVGRLYVWRTADAIHVIDIALLPQARSQGIGTQLLTALIDEARAARTKVTMHVEATNRARALYARLGFVELELRGMHVFVACDPAAALS